MHGHGDGVMKEIPLTKGLVALVDDEDYEWLSKMKWCDSHGYAVRRARLNDNPSKKYIQQMHRAIVGLGYGEKRFVDHIDGNGLNNQRSNLRIANDAENGWNRSANKNNKSGFKGVSLHQSGKWIAQICASRNRLYLGLFVTPEEAHEAYRAAAAKMHGEFANFG
jgi:hypothetical protein